MKVATLVALLAYAAATDDPCPNACSGHGVCGAKDACKCYVGFQNNDCSERTCYFGLAHVDAPKGDLNSDGYVSGPLTTVITGSEVYPWGTSEQYPNADADEGHFYMECSNKGFCDRKSGLCNCFDGYEGSACIRAGCANDCSGHGTCESIKELAEMKGFNTNLHDVPTTMPVGSTNHHDFDLSIEESYAYDLWDQDKSFGCKCDAQFYGADCSVKKCKYGVDPLFYDNSDGVIYQTTVIHLGSKSNKQGPIGGSFRIVFYDVFGEKYVTKQIDAATSSASAVKVRQALESLPDGVISRTSSDVTGTPPTAVKVSMQTNGGHTTLVGGIGAGVEGEGAGLGASGEITGVTPAGYGPEFTVTFDHNPGTLKSIEIDTREINNPGSPDYWVANTRQGQFHSRYSQNQGRVQGLRYGSKLLYTNDDWTGVAPANTMVKVGGQEMRVTDSSMGMLTLSEPFLGASIVPILTKTTVTMSAFDAGTNVATITAPGTTIIGNALKTGAKLYTGDCSYTSAETAAIGTLVEQTTLAVSAGHDCTSDMTGMIYRRTDDPDNQNLYTTTGDTAVATQSLVTTRGSPDVYIVQAAVDGTVSAFTAATSTFTTSALTVGVAAGSFFFVNGKGPYEALSTTAAGANGLVMTAASSGKAVDDFGNADILGSANVEYSVQVTMADSNALVAGKILALAGRRYKVKTAPSGTTGKIVLTDNFAGGQLLQLCTTCITAASANGQSVTSSQRLTLAAGEQILVGGYTHSDLVMTVKDEVSDGVAIVTSAGCNKGMPAAINSPGGTATAITSAEGLALYKHVGALGYVGSIVSESATAATYQYVSQCSGRGSCDSGSGVCQCFPGYGNDNCDEQNAGSM